MRSRQRFDQAASTAETAFGPTATGFSAAASTRERILVSTFVDLAHALADGYDAEALLTLTCHCCAALLGEGTEVAIVIGDDAGAPSTVASSGERARLLATSRPDDGSSPCATAAESGTRVAWQGDLDGGRRPGFSRAARAAGIGSVQAIPLRNDTRVVGVLVVCRDDHAPFPPDDALIAQAVGDVAATAVLHRRTKRDSMILTAQLHHALNRGVVLERAKGVIVDAAGVSVDEAYWRLRRTPVTTTGRWPRWPGAWSRARSPTLTGSSC